MAVPVVGVVVGIGPVFSGSSCRRGIEAVELHEFRCHRPAFEYSGSTKSRGLEIFSRDELKLSIMYGERMHVFAQLRSGSENSMFLTLVTVSESEILVTVFGA